MSHPPKLYNELSVLMRDDVEYAIGALGFVPVFYGTENRLVLWCGHSSRRWYVPLGHYARTDILTQSQISVMVSQDGPPPWDFKTYAATSKIVVEHFPTKHYHFSPEVGESEAMRCMEMQKRFGAQVTNYDHARAKAKAGNMLTSGEQVKFPATPMLTSAIMETDENGVIQLSEHIELDLADVVSDAIGTPAPVFPVGAPHNAFSNLHDALLYAQATMAQLQPKAGMDPAASPDKLPTPDDAPQLPAPPKDHLTATGMASLKKYGAN